MEIKIRVVTNAKKERINREDNGFKVYVMVPPEKGRANSRVIKLVADFLKIKKSQISIIQGLKSKTKTLQIDP